MAELARADTDVAADFEQYLRYLEGSLAQLEDFEQRWERLDEVNRDDLLAEWPLVEVKLGELRRLALRRGVPGELRQRYQALCRRVLRDRRTVERLREH